MNAKKAKQLRKQAKSLGLIPANRLTASPHEKYVTYIDREGYEHTVKVVALQAVNDPQTMRAAYRYLKKEMGRDDEVS